MPSPARFRKSLCETRQFDTSNAACNLLNDLVCALLRWLIAIAFWLSGGFIKSGLGNRIAYGIVSLFGKTTLGLTYSLVFAEALLAPAIPSVAARAGKLACNKCSTLYATQGYKMIFHNLQQDALSLSGFIW